MNNENSVKLQLQVMGEERGRETISSQSIQLFHRNVWPGIVMSASMT